MSNTDSTVTIIAAESEPINIREEIDEKVNDLTEVITSQLSTIEQLKIENKVL